MKCRDCGKEDGKHSLICPVTIKSQRAAIEKREQSRCTHCGSAPNVEHARAVGLLFDPERHRHYLLVEVEESVPSDFGHGEKITIVRYQ